MRRAIEAWTDARLDELAAALEPLPTKVAALETAVEHLKHLAAALEPTFAQIAVLSASVDRLTDENRALRAELAASQRQLIQIGWGLLAAMLGAAGALMVALI
jgi:outer membrane murein-binding lipoprotein Lpp